MQHLVEPVQEIYISDFDVDKHEFKLWTVLEEDPVVRRAHKVWYDPEEDVFGLGMTNPDGSLVYLGDSGSFLSALREM